MRARRVYFLLEALNSFATAYYFYYLFFYTRTQFQFSPAENLGIAALHGLVYIFAARFGGRYAQRRGCFRALKIGFGGVALVLGAGAFWHSGAGQLVIVAAWTFALCFTWPALEALICEGETADLKRTVGWYNLVWAGAAAAAYFVGGFLFERLGPRSLFLLPGVIHAAQWLTVWWCERFRRPAPTPVAPRNARENPSMAPAPPSRPALVERSIIFLRLAWLANPLAYVAINAAMPLIPDRAAELGLTPARAGFFCSIWFFARFAAFFILSHWTGWHYRFSLLVAGKLALIVGFIGMLVPGNLWIVLVMQVVFGLGVGLLYYSSLFYAMDLGETKGEHGGLHESAIGVGIFVGSAIGALSEQYHPESRAGSTLAVSCFLALGFVAMLAMRARGKRLRG